MYLRKVHASARVRSDNIVSAISIRGDKRGLALPLLLDLARKQVFLHDNSVLNLDELLNPRRGALRVEILPSERNPRGAGCIGL